MELTKDRCRQELTKKGYQKKEQEELMEGMVEMDGLENCIKETGTCIWIQTTKS